MQSLLVSVSPMKSKKQITGIRKEYLNSSLNCEKPELNYFTFADYYNGSKDATNNHYKDLLQKLSVNQTNKLTKIIEVAQVLFVVGTLISCSFQ